MRERQAREQGARWGSPSPFELEAWPPPLRCFTICSSGACERGAGGSGRAPDPPPGPLTGRRPVATRLFFLVPSRAGPLTGVAAPRQGLLQARPQGSEPRCSPPLGTSECLPRHTPVTVKTVLYKQMHVHEAHAASRRSLARETTRNPCGRDRAKASRSRNPASLARKARFQKRCNRNCFSGAESAHEPRPSVSAC